MTFLEYFLSAMLFAIYLTAIFTVAAVTFRKGHWIMASWGSSSPCSG